MQKENLVFAAIHGVSRRKILRSWCREFNFGLGQDLEDFNLIEENGEKTVLVVTDEYCGHSFGLFDGPNPYDHSCWETDVQLVMSWLRAGFKLGPWIYLLRTDGHPEQNRREETKTIMLSRLTFEQPLTLNQVFKVGLD